MIRRTTHSNIPHPTRFEAAKGLRTPAAHPATSARTFFRASPAAPAAPAEQVDVTALLAADKEPELRKYLGELGQLREWEDYEARGQTPSLFTKHGLTTRLFWYPLLRGPGRLSHLINEGFITGHDAGQALQEVRENIPKGFTIFGRWFDKIYKGSPFWDDARHRHDVLQERAVEIGNDILAAGGNVRLFDPAAGPGQYVMEILDRLIRSAGSDPKRIQAEVGDYEHANVGRIAANARKMGVEKYVHARQGDAFSVDQLRNSNKPNIAFASGFWELYADNLTVFRAMRALWEALEPGGHLLHTGMHWNDNKWISAVCLYSHRVTRTFSSDAEREKAIRDRAPIRPVDELQRLAIKAGFELGQVTIMRNNYFNVVTLRKPKDAAPAVATATAPA